MDLLDESYRRLGRISLLVKRSAALKRSRHTQMETQIYSVIKYAWLRKAAQIFTSGKHEENNILRRWHDVCEALKGHRC